MKEMNWIVAPLYKSGSFEKGIVTRTEKAWPVIGRLLPRYRLYLLIFISCLTWIERYDYLRSEASLYDPLRGL